MRKFLTYAFCFSLLLTLSKLGLTFIRPPSVSAQVKAPCILVIPDLPLTPLANSSAALALGWPNSRYNVTVNPSSCTFPSTITTNAEGAVAFTISCTNQGSYSITASSGPDNCGLTFEVNKTCAAYGGNCLSVSCSQGSPYPSSDCNTPPLNCCPPSSGGQANASIPIFCVGNDPDQRTATTGSGKLATAIGCIPVGDTNALVGFILTWGLGIAGGIAFILIVVAGFQIITSAGNPQKLQAGKELLTSAIAGIFLIIFAAFILRLIGVSILGIPGF